MHNGTEKTTHVKSFFVKIGRYNSSFCPILPSKVAGILVNDYMSSDRLGVVII
jgi:hypothetical protein